MSKEALMAAPPRIAKDVAVSGFGTVCVRLAKHKQLRAWITAPDCDAACISECVCDADGKLMFTVAEVGELEEYVVLALRDAVLDAHRVGSEKKD